MQRHKAYGITQVLHHDSLKKLELDLATVVPSIAGPKRPQDRIALTDSKSSLEKHLTNIFH
jgi:aconitate hydratase